jgi:ABC-type sugar transport system permease subunit
MQAIKRNKEINASKQKLAYIFLFPPLLILLFFLLSPILSGIYLSLFRISLNGTSEFIGFNNFILLFKETRFLLNLRLTGIFLLGNLIISIPLSYVAAFIITSKIKGINILRSMYLIPWIIAPVVSVVLFRTLVDPNVGPFSFLIEKLLGKSVLLLGDPTTAMLVVILHSAWRSFPFMMLFLSTGISSIPKEVLDASRVDGTNRWQRFRYVIFPLTRIHLIIVALIVSMWTLQDVEGVYSLTQGGPGYSTEVTSVRLFKEGFMNFDLGIGSTIGVILMIFGILLLIIYTTIIGRKSQEITL